MTTFSIEHVAAPTPEVVALIQRHFDLMQSQSPAESCHVMSADALFGDGVRVYAVRDSEGALLGIGALKPLEPGHGELKSMHTKSEARGLGIGAAVVDHLVATARSLGMTRVSLETGADAVFAPARRLYERKGFAYCEPFSDYAIDPYSVFMTRTL